MTPSAPPATPDPAASIGRRDAYIEAICPAFEATALLDPRLAELREAGRVGGDLTPHAQEIEAVAEELRTILNDLEAVPDWTSGRPLRSELIRALHEIRTALLQTARDLEETDAAARLAAVPYVARPTLDLGMSRAVDAGLVCTFE